MMQRLIHRILDLAVSATPNALAASLDERTVTFAEVDGAANAMARALQSLGIKRGSRVLFQAEMTLDHLAFYFATQRLGAAFVPLNPALSRNEVLPIADYIRPDLLVLDPARQDEHRFATAVADVPVAILGAGERATAGVNLDVMAGKASQEALADLGVHDDDTHAIFLTSGSTGRPKGVVLSHRVSWLRSYLGASRFVTSGGRGELMTFPMFHWAGWNYLSEWAVARHTIRNALPQVLAVMGLQFGYLVGGSILVETIFNWPGTGFLLGKAILTRDVPVVQGVVLVLAICFVITNLCVDLIQTAVDPRIKRG